jgi:uncharacterized membrane protein YphA (DoxX/SURF4 family)
MLLSLATVLAADLFGLVLIYGGLAKLRDHMGFRVILTGYSSVPGPTVPALAWFVPVLEFVTGILLLLRPFRLLGAASAAALLVATAAIVWSSLSFGSVPDACGCFGTGRGEKPSPLTVARALTFASCLALIAWALQHSSHRYASADFEIALTAMLLLVAVRLIVRSSELTHRSKSQAAALLTRTGSSVGGIDSLHESMRRSEATV